MQKLKFLTAGESHGKGLLGILEGIPAGLEISESYIAQDLQRRQLGFGRGKRMNIEKDMAEIISGVRHGKTLGSPIGLMIRNLDWYNWQEKMSVEEPKVAPKKVKVPRPGHADLIGALKYGFTDIRNVLERSSARETAMRVALGAIARKLLEEIGIEIGSRVIQIYDVKDMQPLDKQITVSEMNRLADLSPVRCFDPKIEKKMINAISDAKQAGDSVGGVFEVIASGVPLGLGTHVHWDRKLQARISEAVMSINAIKGVEIGLGFKYAEKYGSEVHDEIAFSDNNYVRNSNNAGGIEGGMSNGEPITVKAVMKPIPTLIKPLRSVNMHTKESTDAHKERTDSCAVPAASIIGESMLCLVLADALLETVGGDTLKQIKQRTTNDYRR